MNLTYDNHIKQTVLQYMDKELLKDKKFMSKLQCFDNLCEQFHNDTEYVAYSVLYDIQILKKTKIFDETIIESALKNTHYPKEIILSYIFRYIGRFNVNYEELNSKIKNKKNTSTIILAIWRNNNSRIYLKFIDYFVIFFL